MIGKRRAAHVRNTRKSQQNKKIQRVKQYKEKRKKGNGTANRLQTVTRKNDSRQKSSQLTRQRVSSPERATELADDSITTERCRVIMHDQDSFIAGLRNLFTSRQELLIKES